MPPPSKLKLYSAFAALYVIWGSTYLAIRYAIETLPPLIMAGVRFLMAGAVLYTFLRVRGEERPSAAQWKAALIVGTLLLLGGNGAVVWAEQRVPSGIAALLVATLPLWMVTLESLRKGGKRPSAGVMAGLVLGILGLVILIGPGELAGGRRVDLLGAGVLLLGSFSWASGSIYSRSAPAPSNPFLASAMQMLSGGAALIFGGAIRGELAALDSFEPSLKSVLSFIYLVIFGSLVGFTAYIWLLRVSTPAKVATYAYVNPVVAVILGWALANEPLTSRTLMAAAVIVGAVALITTARSTRGEELGVTGERRVPDDIRLASGPVAAPSRSAAEPAEADR